MFQKSADDRKLMQIQKDTMANPTLNLTGTERKRLRQHKVKQAALTDYTVDELEVMLQVPTARATELYALAEFQQIPSVGVKFAQDLIFLGFRRIDELQGRDGAQLTDEYERKRGYQTDVCVEDQFRLAVYYANTHDATRQWWDFTAERKLYRSQHGSRRPAPLLPGTSCASSRLWLS